LPRRASRAAAKMPTDNDARGETRAEVEVCHRVVDGAISGETMVGTESGRIDVVLHVHSSTEASRQLRAQVETVEAEIHGVSNHPRRAVDPPRNTDADRGNIGDTHPHGSRH